MDIFGLRGQLEELNQKMEKLTKAQYFVGATFVLAILALIATIVVQILLAFGLIN